MKSLVFAVLVTLTSSMAYPAVFPSQPMYYDQPEYDEMDYYYPYALPVQSRSFENDLKPYGLPEWTPVNMENSDATSRANQPAEWRENSDYSDFNQDQIYEDAPITFIPTKNNGAFAGPLAVVPNNKPESSGSSSNALKTEYFTIIDAPNWPFIEKLSQHGNNPAYQLHSHQHGRSSLPLYHQPDNIQQSYSSPYRPFYFPFYYLYRYWER